MGILLLGLVGAGILLSLFFLLAGGELESREHALRLAATEAGLTELGSSGNEITGRWGPFRVTLGWYVDAQHQGGTRIAIDGLGHRSYEFALRKEGMGSALAKAFGEREIELGDHRFDGRVLVHGLPGIVHALLDSQTRQILGELVAGRIPTGDGRPPLEGSVTVSDGALRAEIPDPPLTLGGARLPEALATLLAAARRLVLPEDLAARLAHNARTDPLPGVRLAALLTLAGDYPAHGVTEGALLAACRDDDDEVRLRAATALGDLGREVLLQIASSSEVTDDRSARAVTALGEHLTGPQAAEILRNALSTGRVATATAAAEALGRVGGPDAVEPLSAALLAEDDGLATAAAVALGATGVAAGEDALIAALDRAVPTVWPAVAEALGKVGTAAAVAPLRELGRRSAFDRSLQRASRQAIAEIQSRLTGATPGQLALADGDPGQLALAVTGLEGRVAVAVEGEVSPDTEGGAAGDETKWPTDTTGDAAAAREDPKSPGRVGTPRPRGHEEG